MIKIHGGTRADTELCRTCSHAFIRKGAAVGQESIYCQQMFEKPVFITYPVVECNEYRDATLPSLSEMSKIAWPLNADRKTGKVGFVSSAKVDSAARDLLEHEAREGSPFIRR